MFGNYVRKESTYLKRHGKVFLLKLRVAVLSNNAWVWPVQANTKTYLKSTSFKTSPARHCHSAVEVSRSLQYNTIMLTVD